MKSPRPIARHGAIVALGAQLFPGWEHSTGRGVLRFGIRLISRPKGVPGQMSPVSGYLGDPRYADNLAHRAASNKQKRAPTNRNAPPVFRIPATGLRRVCMLIACALLFNPVLSGAQGRVPNPHPLLVIAPAVRDTIRKHYVATQVDSNSLEFAVCLRFRGARLNEKAAVYTIDRVRWPRHGAIIRRDSATGRIAAYAITDREPCEQDEALGHNHSVEHCLAFKNLPCDASLPWWRFPSQTDIEILRRERQPFAVIFYSDTGIFSYYPDSIDASILARVFDGVDERRRLSSSAYASLLAGGLGANILFKLDRDDGGYVDQPFTQDKLSHLLAGYALAQTAMMLGVDPRVASLGACLAGVGWEYSQGFVSTYDIGASCLGALGAWGVERLSR